MTDKEKIHKTFEKMHASPDILTEVLNMTTNNTKSIRRKQTMYKVAVAAFVCMIVLGTGSAAYAMNLGGIQRKIQIWIEGDQTDAILNISEKSYSLDYKDANGETVHRAGGGIAFDADGNEIPLTEEELLQIIHAPEVTYEEDGSVWVYYYDQKMEITDRFKNDICNILLQRGDEKFYMTIKYQGGYSYSRNKYASPSDFNTD